MSTLKNLKDLFIHHIKDLYNAENQLEKASPEMLNAANDSQLKDILRKHGQMITDHRNALKSIADEMNFEPTGETCHAMTGLIKETRHFLDENADDDVRDAGLIADAQRIAHYFITGYGSISNWAERMDLSNDVQDKCRKGIDDATKIDEMLKDLAKSHVNEEAMS